MKQIKAAIIDLDGTIISQELRKKYLYAGRYDKFFDPELMLKEKINYFIINFIKNIVPEDIKKVIITARPKQFNGKDIYSTTLAQIELTNLNPDYLIMKEKFEPDLLKISEWKFQISALSKFKPEYIFEDRMPIIDRFLREYNNLEAYLVLDERFIIKIIYFEKEE